MALTTLDIIFDEDEMADLKRLADSLKMTVPDFLYKVIKNSLRAAKAGEKSDKGAE